jgi:ketosteroid isomerase-like protein
MSRVKWLVVLLFLATAMLPAVGTAQDRKPANVDGATVEQALSRLVTAFENLDWQKFRSCFSENATIFHPVAPNIKRIDTPDQFDKAWLGVFERIKKNSGRTSPPYMDLHPEDLRIDRLSEDVALATFHLFDGNTVSRRTVVFTRSGGEWKVIHIHASNITTP